NGRFVVFSSSATNLVPNDTNQDTDVFVRDLVANTTTRISVASDGSERQGQNGIFAGGFRVHNIGPGVSLNADGNLAAFSSTAAFVADDTNTICGGFTPTLEEGTCANIYVHDLTTGQTTRASVATDGIGANDESGDPQISANGRFVIFSSMASNLV